MNDWNQALTSRIYAYLGLLESGHNMGPEIDRWNAMVGNPVGSEWCAASAFGICAETGQELNVVHGCPRTGRALDIWSKAAPGRHRTVVVAGHLLVLDHGGGKGHVEFIVGVGRAGYVLTAGGNTNRDGSRTGDSFWAHLWRPSDGLRGRVVGCVDVSPEAA